MLCLAARFFWHLQKKDHNFPNSVCLPPSLPPSVPPSVPLVFGIFPWHQSGADSKQVSSRGVDAERIQWEWERPPLPPLPAGLFLLFLSSPPSSTTVNTNSHEQNLIRFITTVTRLLLSNWISSIFFLKISQSQSQKGFRMVSNVSQFKHWIIRILNQENLIKTSWNLNENSMYNRGGVIWVHFLLFLLKEN